MPRRNSWLDVVLIATFFTFRTEQLLAFPSSLSDCQTPTGWNCSGFDEQDTDLFLCDTNTCKFDGECLRIGDTLTCICDFKCSAEHGPVCGSNGESYDSECLLRRDACRLQTELRVMAQGPCPSDAVSGSGDDINEGSAEGTRKETSTCDICQFGAECDEDSEDIWCVCNIDCSHISFNPVCASNGHSYDNPCQVKELSCQKQERIEVTYLGHCRQYVILGEYSGQTTHWWRHGHGCICPDTNNAIAEPETVQEGWDTKPSSDEKDVDKHQQGKGVFIPCPEQYKNYCIHGECTRISNSFSPPNCSCHTGFTGLQCENEEDGVLHVVPGSGKVRYVLIACIIGALQLLTICLVVGWIIRKCPQNSQIARHKHTVPHFSLENNPQVPLRLI